MNTIIFAVGPGDTTGDTKLSTVSLTPRYDRAREQPGKTICGFSSATRLLTSASPYLSAVFGVGAAASFWKRGLHCALAITARFRQGSFYAPP